MLYIEHSAQSAGVSLYYYLFQLEVEVPKLAEMPWPPPLEEGLSDDIYHTYIDIPNPKSPSQQAAVTAVSM